MHIFLIILFKLIYFLFLHRQTKFHHHLSSLICCRHHQPPPNFLKLRQTEVIIKYENQDKCVQINTFFKYLYCLILICLLLIYHVKNVKITSKRRKDWMKNHWRKFATGCEVREEIFESLVINELVVVFQIKAQIKIFNKMSGNSFKNPLTMWIDRKLFFFYLSGLKCHRF